MFPSELSAMDGSVSETHRCMCASEAALLYEAAKCARCDRHSACTADSRGALSNQCCCCRRWLQRPSSDQCHPPATPSPPLPPPPLLAPMNRVCRRWVRRRSDGDLPGRAPAGVSAPETSPSAGPFCALASRRCLCAGAGSAGADGRVVKVDLVRVEVANCDSTVGWGDQEPLTASRHQLSLAENTSPTATSAFTTLPISSCVEPDSTTNTCNSSITTASTVAATEEAGVEEGTSGVVATVSGAGGSVGGCDSGCCSMSTDSPCSVVECALLMDSPETMASSPETTSAPSPDPCTMSSRQSPPPEDVPPPSSSSLTSNCVSLPALRFPPPVSSSCGSSSYSSSPLPSCASSSSPAGQPGYVTGACAAPAAAAAVVCQWQHCNCQLASPADLVPHLCDVHVRGEREQRPTRSLRCLWRDCKVFGQCGSAAWLQRHVLCHGGRRPFACIVQGCRQRFGTQLMLQRHVNSHFTNVTSPVKRSSESSSNKTRRSRRNLAKDHPYSARIFDFVDGCVMEQLRYRLVQCETALGNLPQVTGHCLQLTAEVLARRFSDSGGEVLVTWHPNDIVKDEWIEEQKYTPTKLFPWRSLPAGHSFRLAITDPSSPETTAGRCVRRKHRRKPPGRHCDS